MTAELGRSALLRGTPATATLLRSAGWSCGGVGDGGPVRASLAGRPRETACCRARAGPARPGSEMELFRLQGRGSSFLPVAPRVWTPLTPREGHGHKAMRDGAGACHSQICRVARCWIALQQRKSWLAIEVSVDVCAHRPVDVCDLLAV